MRYYKNIILILIVLYCTDLSAQSVPYFDSSKAKDELGYTVAPIETALRQSVLWFQTGRQACLALPQPTKGRQKEETK